MKAPDFLNESARLMIERGAQYDQPEGERSMGRAVDMFNAAKGREVLSESDGCLLMVCLKIVRDQQRDKPHLDSLSDGVSYMALYGESRTEICT